MGSAFLFYVDDWLSSSRIDLMSADEERGYLRLLLHAWKQDDCGLPNDDDVLAKWSKLGRKWKQSSARIKQCFFERDGRLYNERLLSEWNHQREFHEKRGIIARAGANARWGKQRQTGDASSIPPALHEALPEPPPKQCLDDANSSPSSSSIKTIDRSPTPVPLDPSDTDPLPAVSDQTVYRGERLRERLVNIAYLLSDFRGSRPDNGILTRVEAGLKGADEQELKDFLKSLDPRRFAGKGWPYLASAIEAEFSSFARRYVITDETTGSIPN